MILEYREIIIQCGQLRPCFRLEHIVVAGVINVVWGGREEQTEQVEGRRLAQVLDRTRPEHIVVDRLEDVRGVDRVVVVHSRVRLAVRGLDLEWELLENLRVDF